MSKTDLGGSVISCFHGFYILVLLGLGWLVIAFLKMSVYMNPFHVVMFSWELP